MAASKSPAKASVKDVVGTLIAKYNCEESEDKNSDKYFNLDTGRWLKESSAESKKHQGENHRVCGDDDQIWAEFIRQAYGTPARPTRPSQPVQLGADAGPGLIDKYSREHGDNPDKYLNLDTGNWILASSAQTKSFQDDENRFCSNARATMEQFGSQIQRKPKRQEPAQRQVIAQREDLAVENSLVSQYIRQLDEDDHAGKYFNFDTGRWVLEATANKKKHQSGDLRICGDDDSIYADFERQIRRRNLPSSQPRRSVYGSSSSAPSPAARSPLVHNPFKLFKTFASHDAQEWRSFLIELVRRTGGDPRPRTHCAYSLRPIRHEAGPQQAQIEHIFECEAMAQVIRDCPEFRQILRNADFGSKISSQPSVVQNIFSPIRSVHNGPDINLTYASRQANKLKGSGFQAVLDAFSNGEATRPLEDLLEHYFRTMPDFDAASARKAAKSVIQHLKDIRSKYVDAIRDPETVDVTVEKRTLGHLAESVDVMFGTLTLDD